MLRSRPRASRDNICSPGNTPEPLAISSATHFIVGPEFVIRDARIATNSAVLEADLELVRQGLVLYTFGNACGISRADGLVVIKPNGVPYKGMRPDHLVVTDLAGSIVDGHLRPSSDLPTHLVLYRQFV